MALEVIAKSNRKEAKKLQLDVSLRLNHELGHHHFRFMSDKLRAELFLVLDDGNRELLPPNGIITDTDLDSVRTWTQKLADRLLLSKSMLYSRFMLAQNISTHVYVTEVVRIINDQFGVVLFENNWGEEFEHRTKRWIYPAREDELLNP